VVDVGNAYPAGRNFMGLWEDLEENSDDWKRIYRGCDQNAADDLYPFCGKKDTE